MTIKKTGQLFTLLLLLLLICPNLPTHGQSIISEYSQNTNFPIQERLSAETILQISNSKRVFITSFKDEGFAPGDFVTLIHNDRHVARAIVAKTNNDRAALKIIKIYSLELWGELKEELEIKILRGDDSYFVIKPEQTLGDGDPISNEIAKIVTEDDLFNEKTLLEEDILEENKGRTLIVSDNIISIKLGSLGITDLNSRPTTSTHFNFSWNHQLVTDFWIEFTYGFSEISGFPDEGMVTFLQTFTTRIKYTIGAPFYSFLQPYVGYKLSAAAAPTPNPLLDTKTPEEQSALLKQQEVTGPAVGITILKRLVPGWFAQFDIGNDIISAGMALEF